MEMNKSQVNKNIEEIKKDYTDKFGLVVQNDHDGGDSLQRSATYLNLRHFADVDPYGLNIPIYREMIKQFEVKPGVYVRHPNKDKWYSNPNNCSRDQMAIAVLSMGLYKDTQALNRVMFSLIKRFGFFQNHHMGTGVPTRNDVEFKLNQSGLFRILPNFIKNPIINFKTKIAPYRFPDILSPLFVSSVIRAYGNFLGYPILVLLDLFMLADVIHFRKLNLWDADNMLAQNVMYANELMPTFVSRLAKRLYAKTDYKFQLANYHCKPLESGITNCKPLGELYVEVCKARIG